MDIILDIDTQVDFMMRHGSLYVPEAENIISNMNKFLSDTYLPIISTIDEHDHDDPEFKTFPVHCVKGASGTWKIPETMVYSLPYISRIMNIGNLFYPCDLRNAKQFIIPKKTYNIWDSELGNPMAMMQVINHFKPEKVFVLGVALDWCIKYAIEGLLKRGLTVFLVTDATKAVKSEDFDMIISGLVERGVKLIKTGDVIFD